MAALLSLVVAGATPAPDSSVSPADRMPESGRPSPSPQESDALFASARTASVRLETSGVKTSGVVISKVGLVVAPGRLLRDGDKLDAQFADGTHLPAQVLISDPAKNLALIRLKGDGPFAALRLAPQLPAPREPLFAVFQVEGQWQSAVGRMVSRLALKDGKLDPTLFQAQVDTSVMGEGAPLLDEHGYLAGLSDAWDQGTSWARSSDALRAFLDRAGLYAADFEVVVSTHPPAAAVELDERPVGRTSAEPLVLKNLTLGRHELRLSAPGLAEDRFVVELLDEPSITIDRTLDTGGTLELSANARAQAWVDGALRGDVPLLLTLPSGKHWVDMRANGYLPTSEPIDVPLGQRTAATVKLVAVRSTLAVDSIPRGAAVSANGEPLGVTPVAGASVGSGAVDIDIALEGKHAYHFRANIAPNATVDLGTFRLEDPYGWLLPRFPPGTQVSLDAGPRHFASQYEPIPIGKHHVAVYAPGYYAYSTDVEIADSQTLAIDPPLALYDRLPARRAVGLGLGGLSVGLGLTALGLALDNNTSSASLPVLVAALVSLGAGAVCLITAGPFDEGGWSQERTWVRSSP